MYATDWNRLKPKITKKYRLFFFVYRLWYGPVQRMATTQHFQLYSLSLLEQIAYRLLHRAPI